MRITTRMYRDVFGHARLFWKCEDCGLEWRADMVRCPRCELAKADEAPWGLIENVEAHHGVERRRLQAECDCWKKVARNNYAWGRAFARQRDSVRQWAAAWKRAAKEHRHGAQQLVEHNDGEHEWLLELLNERDSARRVARALWAALRRARQLEAQIPAFLPPNQVALGRGISSLDAAWVYFKWADAKVRHVLREEAARGNPPSNPS